MGKKATVLSWTLKGRGGGCSQEQVLERMQKMLAECKHLKPDLICFPEEALIACGDHNNPNWVENNRKALEMMRENARALHTNIVICLEEPSEKYPGRSYNTTYVIDRSGTILGKYRKRHITFRAIAGRGLTGERLLVCDTDIGKIGIMTCFDIGWRDDWKQLADMGAELVVWNSAYDGGFLLNAYAAVHMYYVVSTTWGWNAARARVIDPMGQDIAQSSIWDNLAMTTIDLGAEIFHFDHHGEKPAELRAAFGDRISLRVKPNDNIFLLSSNDPEWPLERIKKEFGLQSYRDYHAQSTAENLEMLQKYPEE